MLHITLGDEKSVDPTVDALGRDRVGYKESMSELALYDANHGMWVLGTRAHKERYALVTHRRIVRQAIEIESIEKIPTPEEERSVVNGTILKPGHPVYDTYVGKPTPATVARNPITYFDAPEDKPGEPCRCGCGKTVHGKDFLPGHDQTALHARVKQIGTVAQFLGWFDALSAPWAADKQVASD